MKEERMLFIIDMVNGFVKGGALADSSILEIVPTIKEVIRNKEGILVEVKESHNIASLEFKNFPPHCLEGTWEADTCDELKEDLKNSYKFYKNSTSALFSKGLFEFIYYHQPKEIIIMGCCTDICIMNFAIPLKNLFNELGLDIDIIIYEEAVDTYNSPIHNRDEYNEIAFKLMKQSGIILKSYEKEKSNDENQIKKIKK